MRLWSRDLGSSGGGLVSPSCFAVLVPLRPHFCRQSLPELLVEGSAGSCGSRSWRYQAPELKASLMRLWSPGLVSCFGDLALPSYPAMMVSLRPRFCRHNPPGLSPEGSVGSYGLPS